MTKKETDPGLWDCFADEFGVCRLCGKPFVEHYDFGGLEIRVMSEVLKGHSEITLLYAVSFRDCPIEF